jgi:predicted DCC family thiol-disulfide oxidoreductase YuxK
MATIIFDDTCNFCKASVAWLQAHDREKKMEYLPLQSAEARALLKSHDEQFAQKNTVYLVTAESVYNKSDAVLQALKILPRPYSFLHQLRVFPKPLRNWVYDLIAKNRHRF